jgi:hypothetical protein
VIVEYAHTPDSLENVLNAVRGLTDKRVIVVFGAGGDRDKTKRPLMGEIASRLADETIVTSDNPRSEDPEAIIEEILTGSKPGTPHNAGRKEAMPTRSHTPSPATSSSSPARDTSRARNLRAAARSRSTTSRSPVRPSAEPQSGPETPRQLNSQVSDAGHGQDAFTRWFELNRGVRAFT